MEDLITERSLNDLNEKSKERYESLAKNFEKRSAKDLQPIFLIKWEKQLIFSEKTY